MIALVVPSLLLFVMVCVLLGGILALGDVDTSGVVGWDGVSK